jgi:hypothetical protein
VEVLAAVAASLVAGALFASANGEVRPTPVPVVTVVQSHRVVTIGVFRSDDGTARLVATARPN